MSVMNKDKATRVIEINKVLVKAKGEVLNEFEKVCPNEISFARMKKEMHDIFDQLLEDIRFHI